VVFLHEVAEGAAGRSWGVHVARLAGVPAPVVRRAGALLAALENQAGHLTDAGALPLFAAGQSALSNPAADPPDPAPAWMATFRAALEALEPDRMTPREALEAIYRMKAMLPNEPHPVAPFAGKLS
jgi:DNA mismatch repair protein MutS